MKRYHDVFAANTASNRFKLVTGGILVTMFLFTFFYAQPVAASEQLAPSKTNQASTYMQIPSPGTYQNISVQTAHNMIGNNSGTPFLILDVRYQCEYDIGHLYGAVLMPYDQLQANISRFQTYKNQTIIVYCRTGVRGNNASKTLVNNNFTRVYNMMGGIIAWIHAGYQIYTTQHYATVNMVNGDVNLQIDPWTLDVPNSYLPCFQNGSSTCSTCNKIKSVISGNKTIEPTVTLLSNDTNQVVFRETYDINGSVFNMTVSISVLWRYSQTINEYNRSACIFSTTLTWNGSSIQLYNLVYQARCSDYNFTLQTLFFIDPSHNDIIGRTFTIANLYPASASGPLSSEIVFFNSSIDSLSHQYAILSYVAENIGQIYGGSGDENLTRLATSYHQMGTELGYLSNLVRGEAKAYDMLVLGGSAILSDACADWQHLACTVFCSGVGCLAICAAVAAATEGAGAIPCAIVCGMSLGALCQYICDQLCEQCTTVEDLICASACGAISFPGWDGLLLYGPSFLCSLVCAYLKGQGGGGGTGGTDTTPPTTAAYVDGNQVNGWYVGNVWVYMNTMDLQSGVASTVYSFDQTNWYPFPGDGLELSASGQTTIYYYSTDAAGNVEGIRSTTILIDNTPPTTWTYLDGKQVNGWYVGDVWVFLNREDLQSGVASTVYSFDQTNWYPFPEDGLTLSASGPTTIYYYSTDGAGNVEPIESTAILIDNTPPTTWTYLYGNQVNGWYVGDVWVYLNTMDLQSGVAKTYYSFDQTNWHRFPQDGLTLSASGVTTIYYYSIDGVGNKEGIKSTAIRIDNTPPTTWTYLDGNQVNGWYVGDVWVYLNRMDLLSGVAKTMYSFDQTNWYPYPEDGFKLSASGPTTVYYYSIDGVGNREGTESATIRIDNTPPTTTISLSGTQGRMGWYRSNVAVTLGATDATSGIASIVYSFDGSNWIAYTSPFTVSAEGYIKVYYYSTDYAGNVEAKGSTTILIDKTPPTTWTYLDGKQVNGWYVGDVWVYLNRADYLSGFFLNETGYSFDQTNWYPYPEDGFKLSASGVTTVYYYSIDVAENMEGIESTTIRIDNTPPVTTIVLSGTQGQNGWYTSNVMVTLSAADALSGVASTWYSLDNVNWVNYTNSGPFVVPTEGYTTVYFWSSDWAGNFEPTKTATIMIDKSPPTTTASLSGTLGLNGWFVSRVNLTLSTTDSFSGVDYTEYQIDNGPWTSYAGFFTIGKGGTTTVCYRSVDKAGNVESIETLSFKIDTTPPTTVLLIGTHYVDDKGNIYITSNTAFTLTATDDFSGVAHTYYRINGGQWIEYVKPFNVTGSIGTYTIDYYSIDGAGNIETPKTTTVILEQAFQGVGALLIGKVWYTGKATLFLSDHMIRIQIDDKIATWNIVKHCKSGQFEYYYGEGPLGCVVMTIYRGQPCSYVLVVGIRAQFYAKI